ncbi:MAG: AsmA family protein [Pseudomonadota bacterium]
MHKALKYGLWSVGGVVAVAAGVAGYVVATFDPNAYKGQIIQAVQEKKHRTLKLDGDIKLSFFPNIGANLGKVALSEFENPQEFAAVENVRVSLALVPLFSGRAVVDEVSVSGLRAHLVKFKDGKTNIDDLLSKDESKPSDSKLEFDIAAVSVDKTELDYRDEASGAQYALKDVRLKTGRIANGVPSKVDFAAVVQANQPKVALATAVKATLTFDLDKKFYRIEGLDLNASGEAAGITGLALKASGDASANLAAQEYTANKLALTANGTQGGNQFEAKLDLPALNFSKTRFSGDKLALDVDVKQSGQAFKLRLTAPLAGDAAAQQFSLSPLVLAVQANGEKLPNKSISSELKGSVQIDAKQQKVSVDLAGGLLQSQVKAKVAVNGFSPPAIHFDAEVDQFDADLYLPPKSPQQKKEPEQPFDLSALKSLNLEGTLRIGSLKAANVKLSQLKLEMKAQNGVVNVSPLSANLYQGSLNGGVTVNAAQATPGFAIHQNLNGVNVAPLLKDAAGFDTLEGKGNVAVNVTTQGNTVGALKKGLNGAMSLNLADGAIRGINIAKKLREAGSLVGKTQTQGANKDEKTDFSELKGKFKVSNGVAHNDDLAMKSPLLRLAGNGDINIGEDSINYLAKATLVKTLEGQGGKDNLSGVTVPVRVSGPFADLKYTLDFSSMVGDAAKQKVEAKKEEVKTKLQEQLKGGLQNIFK